MPRSYASFDESVRIKKAHKIRSILEEFVDLYTCDVLDIGTGSGHIVQKISEECRTAVGVDLVDERIVKDGFAFVQVRDENLPFENASFDVVISNHVIEHTSDQELHLAEIHRVLRPGGIVYLATPNKYAFFESHHRLLLLSWFPKKAGILYLRLMRNDLWDVVPLSFPNLKKMAAPRFDLRDMTLDVIKRPDVYCLDMGIPLHPLFKAAPLFVLRIFKLVVPSFIVILRKRDIKH